MKYPGILAMILFLLSCKDDRSPDGDWIAGNRNEQIKTIEKHFRGLDMAMIEIDHRYQELYWAGKDENWEYAAYQVDKIRLSMENAVERRPKRARSAEHFLQTVLPDVRKSVTTKDSGLFNRSFQLLTLNCNACHVAENIPHFMVKPPLTRLSSIRLKD